MFPEAVAQMILLGERLYTKPGGRQQNKQPAGDRKQPAQWFKDAQRSTCPRRLEQALKEEGRALGAKRGGSRRAGGGWEVGEGLQPPWGFDSLQAQPR